MVKTVKQDVLRILIEKKFKVHSYYAIKIIEAYKKSNKYNYFMKYLIYKSKRMKPKEKIYIGMCEMLNRDTSVYYASDLLGRKHFLFQYYEN